MLVASLYSPILNIVLNQLLLGVKLVKFLEKYFLNTSNGFCFKTLTSNIPVIP